jgi:NAD+ kinase
MERSVGIVVHRSNPAALTFAGQVIARLQERGVTVRVDSETAHKLEFPTLACTPDQMTSVEFIITLGGDGTILTTARMAAPCGIPILGVHMGRFGFITEIHPENLFPHLEEILNGKMRVEERLMIRAEVWREGKQVHGGIGLNETVIKSGMSHLLRLNTHIGGAPFATYPADGLIVATPTGSTGYALSAGGPLVTPTIQAFVMVPICPHTLSARPLVLPCDEVIEVEIEADDGELLFAVDGADPFTLQNGDHIRMFRADYVTRLIVFGHVSFYRKVRDRYLYGERLNG